MKYKLVPHSIFGSTGTICMFAKNLPKVSFVTSSLPPPHFSRADDSPGVSLADVQMPNVRAVTFGILTRF